MVGDSCVTLSPSRSPPVVTSIAILLEKRQRNYCFPSSDSFTPQLLSSLWGLDIVFGGTLLRGWVMLGTWGSLSFALWICFMSGAALLCPLPAQSQGSVAGLQPPPPFLLCTAWVLVSREVERGRGVLGSGCAENIPRMNIVATVVALELCLFLVLPSTWLAPAAHWEGCSRPWHQHGTAVNYKTFLLPVA